MSRRKPLPTHVAVGRVVGTHSLGGAVRVESLTDFPERFREGQKMAVVLPGERREVRIRELKHHGRVLLIKFFGIDSIEEAEALRGGQLEVPRSEVFPLPVGHYYVYQLMDLPVYTENGALLGYVEDILRTGSNDVYVVRRTEGEKEILLPATKEVVRAVDLEREEIRVRLLPGLGE